MALCSHWWTETRSVDDKNWNTTSSSINLIDCGLFSIFYLAFVDRCFKSRCKRNLLPSIWQTHVGLTQETSYCSVHELNVVPSLSPSLPLYKLPCNYLCGSLNYEDLFLCSHLNVHDFSHSSLYWLTFLFTTFSASDQDKKTRKTTMKLLFWGC